MKRRRGSKKGRAKKLKLVSTNEGASNAVSPNTEDNSGLDESDHEDVDSEVDAVAEAETKADTEAVAQTEPEVAQPATETSQPKQPLNADSVGRPISNAFGKAVYTRVKVRIKTSKNLDPQRASSDVPSQSDTEKSGPHMGSEKQGVPAEKMEGSANSLSEKNGGGSGNTSQKSLGIKIKSRGLGSASMSPCSNTETIKGDRVEKKDTETLHLESRFNEQELKAALEVIKKVMKMDAAEPFNAPVNPVALGIPDYFEVIKSPMDFGTICSNLEKGVKYKNSEDVFKDVQYIWENCYKYNNKGDYIVELMKRVKKSFTKYWTALGLFNDQPQENNGSESNAVKELSPSSEGNTPVNSGALNLSGKRFHGLKKHKEGCQCAICVMMRRRQEREEIARMMDGQTGSDDSMGEEDNKPNGISRGGSPFGEYASSNMKHSPNVADAETDKRGQEMKLGHIRNFYCQHMEDSTAAGKRDGLQDMQLDHRCGDEDNPRYLAPQDIRKDMHTQNDDGNAAVDERPQEALDQNRRAKMLENLRYLENPMLVELCGTLFSENSLSFWNGPHSLVSRDRRAKRRSSFSSAIASLMKS